jgi:nicotinamidase-related amidase
VVEADLPRSKRALLLVDFINPLDFPGSQDLAPGALEAAVATARLVRALRVEGVPVVYANDNFGKWHSDFSTMVRKLERGAGHSARIVRLLKPKTGDLTVLKPMHSAFFGSPLDILLGKMGTRSLIVAGLATDICVQLTAMDGFLRGLKMHVPADCTAAESPAKKQVALTYMRDILKCDVRPWW